jgi:pyruvate dehydrogenase E1 component alpha subunit/2-oxoisovalerate dehydrogenase E1 component alpha subunit
MPEESSLAGARRVLGDEGELVAGETTPLTEKARLRLYREMRRARRVDERLSALQRQGAIGFHGSSLGQEAVPIGAAFAVSAEDWVFPALREAAVLLCRGLSLVDLFAQSFGTARDLAKGRQMPSHAFSRALRVVSWSSCIATQLPHAVGMAYAAHCRKDPVIALAFLGDGATSHPDFHAALNLAGVLRVPVVFVCQNNQYALSVPVTHQTASASIAVKARAYGIEGRRVDGNDVLAVHDVVHEASERARGGGGATLVECVTYRLGPHSTSDDPTRYRSAAEEARWAERDPIARLRRHLVRVGTLDPALDARLGLAIDTEIDAALALVSEDAPPSRSSLFDDIYETRPFHLSEQAAGLEIGTLY